jgi:hypothetical protein
MDMFNSVLPVKLIPKMSHLNLGQAFSKVKGPLTVFVYDSKKLLKGSPFDSYAEVCAAIGIDRRSMIVRRYIDSGKLYNNRYCFFSVQIN